MGSRLALVSVVALALPASGALLLPRFRARAEAPLTPADPPFVAAFPGSAPAPSDPPPRPSPLLPPLPAYARVHPGSEAACGKGMVLVDGVFCPNVGHVCARFADASETRCAEFGPHVLCDGRLERRRFCVDVFEYPNERGAKPAAMASLADARRACAAEGKRLCALEEWVFACESTRMWPFPYGARRDPEACNIDRELPQPSAEALEDPFRAALEVARVDGRVRSGERTACVSPFGVRDATGNVEEWVENPTGEREGSSFPWALAGGGFSPSAATCRAVRKNRSANYRSPQTGFRCCKDAPGAEGRRAISILREKGRGKRPMSLPGLPAGGTDR